MNLSKLAEKQLAEIQYSFSCSKNKAISYAPECLHAFENITDGNDQIYNWLDDNYKDKYTQWQNDNKDEMVKLESN